MHEYHKADNSHSDACPDSVQLCFSVFYSNTYVDFNRSIRHSGNFYGFSVSSHMVQEYPLLYIEKRD